MTAVPFNTLKMVEELEAGGFSHEQARAAVSVLVDAASGADLATKADLKTEIALLEQRLTVRFGSMMIVAVGVLLAAIRYLPVH